MEILIPLEVLPVRRGAHAGDVLIVRSAGDKTGSAK